MRGTEIGGRLALRAGHARRGRLRSERAAAEQERSETTLFLAGIAELSVIEVEAGRAVRVPRPELGAGDPPHLIAPVGDRLAMWSYDVTSVPLADPAAEPTTLANDGWIFIPAADPDRIWVGFLHRDSPPTERGLEELREIDSAGNVVTRGVVPPDGAWPYAEVGGGLLFQSPRPTLWDPDTGTTIRSWKWEQIGDMGPVTQDLLASSHYESGELVLTDVVSGEQRRIAPPQGGALLAWEGAFSPNGDTLAVPAKTADELGGQTLALVDVASGELELVPGSAVRGGYVFTAWSRDGEAVFLTGGGRGSDREIVAYQLGEARAEPLNVAVGDFYDIAAG
jgi:hypothetical protein